MNESPEKKFPTVVEALAMAEAWNERAALLSTLAFEVTDVFSASGGRVPPFLIQRLAGGATAANPQNVEDVRNELFAAAERARDEAQRILSSVAVAPMDAHAPGLDGEGGMAPRVDYGAIEIPRGGYEIVENPVSPRPHSVFGVRLDADGNENLETGRAGHVGSRSSGGHTEEPRRKRVGTEEDGALRMRPPSEGRS